MNSTKHPRPVRRASLITVGAALYIGLLMVLQVAALGLIIATPIIDRPLGAWLYDFADALFDDDAQPGLLISAMVIAATQAVFLIPLTRLRLRTQGRGKSLAVSIGLVGLIAALLFTGIVFALMELGASLITGVYTSSPWRSGQDIGDEPWAGWVLLATLGGGWVVWSAVLFLYTRNLWADRALGRCIGLLIRGTIIELLIVIPIDIMVRRRTDCYCATGTCIGLVASSFAALWLAGPGVVFLLTSKRRKAFRRTHCAACGYPKGPSPGDRCPECGFAWKAADVVD